MTLTDTAARHDRALARALTLANPYLDEFLVADGAQVMATMPYDRIGDTFRLRDQLVRKYAWAVPNAEAIATIVAYGPVVELGAGTGYWSMLAAAAGCDVVAHDVAPPGATNPYIGSDSWFDVRPGSVDVLVGHPDRTLLLCWPPYNTPFAHQAIEAYPGDTVIYVGEGWGGCTADDGFHEALATGWERAAHVRIPHWPGLHDSLAVYQRR